MASQNCRLWFALQNVFSLYQWLKVSNWSENQAQMRSAVAEKIEKSWAFMHCMGEEGQAEIVVSNSCSWKFSAFAGDYGCWIGQETRNWAQMRSVVVERLRNTVLAQSVRRGDLSQKSLSLIRAAECFWPFHVIMGVKSVWKDKMGLKYDLWLSRKLRIKVAIGSAHATWHRTGCSVLQYSRQPLIRFESCFVFSDRFNKHNHLSLRLLKSFCSANQRQWFSGCPSSRNDTNPELSLNFSIISANAGSFRALFRVNIGILIVVCRLDIV
jgi:hypothetical protein